jgi:hypothetical protein
MGALAAENASLRNVQGVLQLALERRSRVVKQLVRATFKPPAQRGVGPACEFSRSPSKSRLNLEGPF